MTILLVLAVQTAPTQLPDLRFDLEQVDAASPASLSWQRRCDRGSDDDAGTITVCGSRRSYRLPLPVAREASDPDAHAPGDAPIAAAAITPRGQCGIFAGERNCGKRETRRYGYGGGRDPLTLLTRLGTALIDPDAE